MFLAGCGSEAPSPEEQIRAFIAVAEGAAEARELPQIRALISPHYADEHGRTRQHLVRIAAGYFLRHKSIHILTKIDHLAINEEGTAEVVLYVATAASPISGIEQLMVLRADLHRFDLQLKRDKEEAWRLQSAQWRRAKLEDFTRNR